MGRAAACPARHRNEAPCREKECLHQPFNYKFCDPATGKSVARCTMDPNNEPGLKPLKRALPLSRCPDFSNVRAEVEKVRVDISSPLDPLYINVFRNNRMSEMLALAANAWNSMCPSRSPDAEYDGCCLQVRWTNDIRDMGSYPYAIAQEDSREEDCPISAPALHHGVRLEHGGMEPHRPGRYVLRLHVQEAVLLREQEARFRCGGGAVGWAFSVLPNPAHTSLTLRLPDSRSLPAMLTIRLIDATGSTVHETPVEEPAGEIVLEIPGIPDGVYVLTLTNRPCTHGEKILIRRQRRRSYHDTLTRRE